MSGNPDLGLLGEFPGQGNQGGDAFNIAIFTIVSMVVIVGITFFLGRLMQNRRLEDWAKIEFLQVIISAAIVGGLFFLMAPETGVITGLFNNLVDELPEVPMPLGNTAVSSCINIPESTVLCYAYSYLVLLQAQINQLLVMLISSNTILDIISKISIDIIVIEITPLSGLSSIVQVLNNMIQTLIFLNITIGIELALLQFINASALTIFLPVGVVLRSFFATRRIGGALIALAIGLYLVFPLTIALNAKAVDQMSGTAFEPLVALSAQTENLNPITAFDSAGDILSPESWSIYLESFRNGATALVEAIKSVPEILSAAISILLVQIVFLPVLSVMLTLITIKEMAALFGGEVNLSRFEV
ncbi:hypothetical protein JXA56_02395 [Candidatus Micrarchaeota archaeon]|nr:hypothetical protein [Candidatus Micrarchaeota archaeon]